MREHLQRILELQPVWTSQKTSEMDERGQLVRHAGRDWLRSFSDSLVESLNFPAEELLIEGRDATGPKSEVPWFRFSSRVRSPKATIGWYCVYLFDTRGEYAYLCLSHGSSDWVNGNFETRPHTELRAFASWARNLLNVTLDSRPDFIENIELFSRRSDLGPAYEASTALAIRYRRDNIPADEVLEADALFFAGLLNVVYQNETTVPISVGVAPEIQELDETLEKAAGKKVSRGQGFRLSAKQRKAIELQAMELAKAELEQRGFNNIRDTSKNKPYDFRGKFQGQEFYIEVKGTTSPGETIILTRGEVELHQGEFPCNALIIVHGIKLVGEGFEEAIGGSVRFISPWEIDKNGLTVVGYTYKV